MIILNASQDYTTSVGFVRDQLSLLSDRSNQINSSCQTILAHDKKHWKKHKEDVLWPLDDKISKMLEEMKLNLDMLKHNGNSFQGRIAATQAESIKKNVASCAAMWEKHISIPHNRNAHKHKIDHLRDFAAQFTKSHEANINANADRMKKEIMGILEGSNAAPVKAQASDRKEKKNASKHADKAVKKSQRKQEKLAARNAEMKKEIEKKQLKQEHRKLKAELRALRNS